MRNVERIDGASYTPTARILLQNIDVRAEIISEKGGDSQKIRSAGSAQTTSTRLSFSLIQKNSAHAVRTTLKR